MTTSFATVLRCAAASSSWHERRGDTAAEPHRSSSARARWGRRGRRRDSPPAIHRDTATSRAHARRRDDGSAADEEAGFVERDTREWLERVVMGLNLCPFARAALPGTKVVVTAAATMADLRRDVSRELAILKDADVSSPQTTLVVLPPRALAGLDAVTFDGFMEGCYKMAEEETRAVTAAISDEKKRELNLIGELVEIVPFHPRATFGAVDAEDEADSDGYICTYLDVFGGSTDDDTDGADQDAGEWEVMGDDAEEEEEGGVHRGYTMGKHPEEGEVHMGYTTGKQSEEGAMTKERVGGESGGGGAGKGLDEASLRRLIEDHAQLRGGADTRADWLDANGSSGEDDPADYTGRSPHPVLHLLRQADVDAADEVWFSKGPGDDIRAKNAALLRGMGVEKLRKMLRACVTDGGGGGGGGGKAASVEEM